MVSDANPVAGRIILIDTGQTRYQFLAVAKKKRPRINKIRKALKQQLGHLRRNLSTMTP